jgi:hypothetical protein
MTKFRSKRVAAVLRHTEYCLIKIVVLRPIFTSLYHRLKMTKFRSKRVAAALRHTDYCLIKIVVLRPI